MTVISQIEQDLITSMKAGQAERTGVLRLLKAGFKNEQIKVGHELNEDEVLKVLQHEAKQRRDSITAYTKAERPELAAAEAAELAIIATYLPQPLTEAELTVIVAEVITQLGDPGPGAMGQVIGAVMGRVGTRADGGTVANVVRERLA